MKYVLCVLMLCMSTVMSQQPSRSGSHVGGKSDSGEYITCDLADSEQMKNIGSHIDGMGMCVFTAIEHAARYHGIEGFRGFRDWVARKYPGGGYPEKVDETIKAYCKAKGIPIPPYIQYRGKDVESVLTACDKTGRMAAITYGYSPRYNGASYIAHMTNCIKFSPKLAVCLDNNFPGSTNYEWMSQEELANRVKWHSGTGWIFVWLAPSPPPVPY